MTGEVSFENFTYDCFYDSIFVQKSDTQEFRVFAFSSVTFVPPRYFSITPSLFNVRQTMDFALLPFNVRPVSQHHKILLKYCLVHRGSYLKADAEAK